LRGSFVQEHTRANLAWRDLERHTDLGHMIASLEGASGVHHRRGTRLRRRRRPPR
jgi:hypothetical protein